MPSNPDSRQISSPPDTTDNLFGMSPSQVAGLFEPTPEAQEESHKDEVHHDKETPQDSDTPGGGSSSSPDGGHPWELPTTSGTKEKADELMIYYRKLYIDLSDSTQWASVRFAAAHHEFNRLSTLKQQIPIATREFALFLKNRGHNCYKTKYLLSTYNDCFCSELFVLRETKRGTIQRDSSLNCDEHRKSSTKTKPRLYTDMKEATAAAVTYLIENRQKADAPDFARLYFADSFTQGLRLDDIPLRKNVLTNIGRFLVGWFNGGSEITDQSEVSGPTGNDEQAPTSGETPSLSTAKDPLDADDFSIVGTEESKP